VSKLHKSPKEAQTDDIPASGDIPCLSVNAPKDVTPKLPI